MNNDALNQFMTQMVELLKNTKDFAKEQIPLICQEVLRYKIFESFFSIFCELAWNSVYMLSMYLLIKKLTKETTTRAQEDAKEVWGVFTVIFGLAGGIAFIICVCSIFCDIETIVKLTTAPRVFLIEYFSQLVTKK